MEFVQDAVRGGILTITTSALAALITQAFTILRRLMEFAKNAATLEVTSIVTAFVLPAIPANTFGNFPIQIL